MHPVVPPFGIVEQDHHMVEVLEQLIGLLEDRLLDGDLQGGLYLFDIIEGERHPVLVDGELLEGG